MNRTRAYWPTRILLATGIVAVGIVAVVLAAGATSSACFSCDRSDVLGVPSDVLVPVVSVGLAVVGLAWMVRIFRGPRDEPAPWRYRDRR